MHLIPLLAASPRCTSTRLY